MGRSRLSNSQVAGALREAQQLQQDGHLDDAIRICEELLAEGVDRSDVHYFLGWLYQEADRWDDAAGRFELLLNDPEYALSCYYALGQCARAMGQLEDAAHYFDEAVDRVNLDALTLDEVDQLLQLCQEAAEAHRDMRDREGAETVYAALLGFLNSQGWSQQADEVEQMMRETLGTSRPQPHRRTRNPNASHPLNPKIPTRGPGVEGAPHSRGLTGGPLNHSAHGLERRSGLMPALDSSVSSPRGLDPGLSGPGFGKGMKTLVPGAGTGPFGDGGPGSDHLSQLINQLGGAAGMRSSLMALPEPLRSQVSQAVRDIENYVSHGLLTAAIEECMRVMEIAPQYLDIHLLLGEIYVRQGSTDQAIAKYAVLVDTYLANGRVDDAIATYRRILQLEPNNLTSRTRLIDLLVRQGRMDEVLVERTALADAYQRMGYADRAIQEYEQALMAQPNNLLLRMGYAQALMKSGRAAQAVGEFQRVLQVDPYNTRALAAWQIAISTGAVVTPSASAPGIGSPRAAAMEVLGRLLNALRSEHLATYNDLVREYVQANDLSATNPDLRYALGQVHLAAGRAQEALTCFQQIATVPGMEVLARFAAGQALLASGDPAGAAAAVRELEEASAAARRTPPEPAVWAARPRLDGEEQHAPELEVAMLLSRAYQLSGQAGPAHAVLQQAQGSRPADSEVYQALAQISARAGDPQAQLREYAKLVAHYKQNRQQENAVAVLREMARLAPDDPAVRSELAEIHVARGMLEEGMAEYHQLADIHVRHGNQREAAAVYQKMAEIQWQVGNQREGLTLLSQAINFATDNMEIRQQYVQYCLEIQNIAEAVQQQVVVARYYFASRQTKEAVAALQQLIAMDRTNYEAYDLLGQTYYSVGEYEQAARVYRNLAKVDPTNAVARARLQELQAVRSQFG